ncbi:MAG: hypothetical protein PVS2B2_26800 [Candidatus Acidiferrum sp.]
MSNDTTLEGLRRELETQANGVSNTTDSIVDKYRRTGAVDLAKQILEEFTTFRERFWQIVDAMEHTPKYYDWNDSPCSEDCAKCALEKLGGERRSK